FAAGADHPVAGNDDGNGVAAVGQAHGPYRGGVADKQGDVLVAAVFAMGNGLQGPPDALLEGRAPRRQGQVELAQAAVEISPQLVTGVLQQGAGRWAVSHSRVLQEVDLEDGVIAGGDIKGAQGAWQDGVHKDSG